MASFKFELQSILNLRNQVENNMKNEMGNAVRKLEDQKVLLLEIETTRKQYMDGVRKKSQTGARVSEIRTYSEYIGYITEQKVKQQDNVTDAERCVDSARDKLIKAMKERKIMDKLREGKYENYLKAQVAAEQIITDEVISYTGLAQKV